MVVVGYNGDYTSYFLNNQLNVVIVIFLGFALMYAIDLSIKFVRNKNEK